MNSRAVMTRLAAQGTITAHRSKRRPANSLAMNWASARLISMVRATVATTQIAVFLSTTPSDGWPSTDP